MGGLAKSMGGLAKPINKITGLHDKMDPLGKKLRDKVEDAAGVPRSGKIGTALFGGEEDAQTPQMSPTAVMPTADDEAVSQARRRALARQQRQGGRSSTILSDTDTLG